MQIEIFTGPNCAYCAAAKRLLDDKGQDYVEKDITDHANMAEFRDRLPRQKRSPRSSSMASTSAATRIYGSD